MGRRDHRRYSRALSQSVMDMHKSRGKADYFIFYKNDFPMSQFFSGYIIISEQSKTMHIIEA